MSEPVRLDLLSRQVYRLRAEQPRAEPEELARQLGVPAEVVQSRQELLASLRLLEPVPGGTWAVRNPDAAADQLLAPEEEALAQSRRRMAERRAELSTLTADYLEARRLTAISGQVEVVLGLEHVRTAITDLSALALTNIDTMAPGGGHSEEALQAALPLDLAALARGVRLRTLFQHPARTHYATGMYATTAAQHGAQLRTVGILPTRMILYDRQTVLLPLHSSDTGMGAVIVRDRAVVEVFDNIFETYWTSASDFAAPDQLTGLAPTDLELSVLRLLAVGKKDEVVARQIGLSVRSTRRVIAEVMTRLGAGSRFQAGVRAVSRGWIAES